MKAHDLQINEQGRLRHLLTIEGMEHRHLVEILDYAESFVNVTEREVKKVPLLRGKTVVNLFFEASTRTRTTFELAAKRLSADVLNLSISTSAAAKGESLLDTLRNLEAMRVDVFVVRHAASGAAHFIAKHCEPHVAVLNAGDGWHSHPTQALLDVFTIRRHRADFGPLIVAIVGDIMHSRVARSQIHALKIMGAGEIRVVAPRTLLPIDIEDLGVVVHTDLDQGLKDAEVVIALRLQRERMQGALLPSAHEYYHRFGITKERLRHVHPNALIMHPGPINRGVEMSSAVADGLGSLILEQVSNGLAVRMSAMALIAGNKSQGQRGEPECESA